MGKDKRTGLGEVDVSGAAAVVDTLVGPRPKASKLKSKSIHRTKKVDSGISKSDATKLELPVDHKLIAALLKLPEFQSPQSEKLQIPMNYELIAALDRIEKWIMAKRTKGQAQQRITKNSIVRACLKVLLPVLYVETDKLTDISTEQELVDRISNLLEIKKPESKTGKSQLSKLLS